MRTYTVRATRDRDGWWTITVPGLPVVSQARRLAQVRALAEDAIRLWLDDPKAQLDLSIEIVGFTAARNAWRKAQKARSQADELTAVAAADARRAVRSLAEAGLTVRDISAVLGVSHQRVQQLGSQAKPRRVAKAGARATVRK